MKQSDGVAADADAQFQCSFMRRAMQAIGMKQADMGISYVFVLGVEAITAVVLSRVPQRDLFGPARRDRSSSSASRSDGLARPLRRRADDGDRRYAPNPLPAGLIPRRTKIGWMSWCSNGSREANQATPTRHSPPPIASV